MRQYIVLAYMFLAVGLMIYLQTNDVNWIYGSLVPGISIFIWAFIKSAQEAYQIMVAISEALEAQSDAGDNA